MILIDHAHLQMLDVPTEGVAEHDELDDRKDERHDNERRTAAEACLSSRSSIMAHVRGILRRPLYVLRPAHHESAIERIGFL